MSLRSTSSSLLKTLTLVTHSSGGTLGIPIRLGGTFITWPLTFFVFLACLFSFAVENLCSHLLWNSPSSYLILSTMPLPSYQMNYLTLILFQFGCYGTAPYLIFYILSLFGLVDIIIRFDSCLALLHTADSMPSHYFILLTLKPYSYSAKLYSYSAISLYVLSFTPYLLIFLSLTHLIAESYLIGGYLDYILLDDKPELV